MKLRPKTQTFLGKTTIKSYYCIEHQSGPRSWRLLGDENGVFKFATAAERDAKIEELMATHAPNVEVSDADPSTGAFDPK